jgi:TetR/AcrR family transcriptional regulator, transcriptional repressor for nem operon
MAAGILCSTMRYGADHKKETHHKIVRDASRRVRAKGISGAAVAAVMQDAGLTHGGFYKHFASKDELLTEAVGEAFREMGDRLVLAAEQAPPSTAWKVIVTTYLDAEHSDHAETGCPLTSLAPEIARADERMKTSMLGELMKYRNRMLPFMPGRRKSDRERAFILIFSTMIGTIEIARMLPEPSMRRKVLADARDFLLQSF